MGGCGEVCGILCVGMFSWVVVVQKDGGGSFLVICHSLVMIICIEGCL